jgi:type II secretory pathway predicted ATPase ExeA
MKGLLLESLRGLLNFEDPSAGGKLLQIILFAMPGINRKLRYAPSFSNRLVRTELRRMNRMEMEDMLKWRFNQAGGRFFPFDTPSLDQMLEVSKGNPRTICGIAQLALEYTGATNKAVTPDIISEVAKARILN